MATRIASTPSLLGYLVQHRFFGCCKIISIDGRKDRSAAVRRRRPPHLLAAGDRRHRLQAATLHAGALRSGRDGQLTIVAHAESDPTGPRHYRIVYEEDGLSARSARSSCCRFPRLLPIACRRDCSRDEPIAYATFGARHRLLVAWPVQSPGWWPASAAGEQDRPSSRTRHSSREQ